MLCNDVQTLTAITKYPNFNTALFKAMDKVCQLIYNQHKELKQAFYRVSIAYVVFRNSSFFKQFLKICLPSLPSLPSEGENELN